MSFTLVFSIYLTCGAIYAAVFIWQLHRANELAEEYPPEDQEEVNLRESLASSYHAALHSTNDNPKLLLVVLFLFSMVAWAPLLIYSKYTDFKNK